MSLGQSLFENRKPAREPVPYTSHEEPEYIVGPPLNQKVQSEHEYKTKKNYKSIFLIVAVVIVIILFAILMISITSSASKPPGSNFQGIQYGQMNALSMPDNFQESNMAFVSLQECTNSNRGEVVNGKCQCINGWNGKYCSKVSGLNYVGDTQDNLGGTWIPIDSSTNIYSEVIDNGAIGAAVDLKGSQYKLLTTDNLDSTPNGFLGYGTSLHYLTRHCVVDKLGLVSSTGNYIELLPTQTRNLPPENYKAYFCSGSLELGGHQVTVSGSSFTLSHQDNRMATYLN